MARRWKIALRVLVGAAVLLPFGGWLYEQGAEARDARRFPPPGRLIDVGGRRLHLLCIGSGRPIVLFEASGFSNSASTSDARASLARHTTVCSYDRAGVGWSDSAPAVFSIGALAEDLRAASERAVWIRPSLSSHRRWAGWSPRCSRGDIPIGWRVSCSWMPATAKC